MQPPNGAYNLTTLPQPGPPPIPSTTVRYVVGPDGIPTTFGLLEWDPSPPPGEYRHGDTAIRFISPTEFVAVNGADNYAGTYAPA